MKSAALALLALSCLCFAQQPGRHLIQRVAAGFRYADGLAIESSGAVLVADPPEDRILRLVHGKPPAVFRSPSGGAAGLAFDSRHRLVICETEARRVSRLDEDGRLTVLAERYEGKRLNGPNDLAIRSDGHIYFTDPAFGSAGQRRELSFHGVFHLSPNGGLEAVYRTESRPAGVALSPDQRTLYVTFADERLVRAFDAARGGGITNPRVLIPKTGGVPLGVRTDQDGNLLVAAGEFLEIYTRRGALIEKIRLPDRVANLAVHPATGDIYAATRGTVHLVARGARAVVQP